MHCWMLNADARMNVGNNVLSVHVNESRLKSMTNDNIWGVQWSGRQMSWYTRHRRCSNSSGRLTNQQLACDAMLSAKVWMNWLNDVLCGHVKATSSRTWWQTDQDVQWKLIMNMMVYEVKFLMAKSKSTQWTWSWRTCCCGWTMKVFDCVVGSNHWLPEIWVTVVSTPDAFVLFDKDRYQTLT
jgi:hypothetical protein